jgi:hypothetical protein
VAQRDDLQPAGVDLREHDGGLVGLGAGAREVRLLEAARREAGERLGERDDREGGVERRDVSEAVDLGLDGRVHLVVRVPDGDREDPAEEVEVAFPVGVLQVHPLARLEDDRFLVVVRDGREEEFLVLRAHVGGGDRKRRGILCFGNRAHVKASFRLLAQDQADSALFLEG